MQEKSSEKEILTYRYTKVQFPTHVAQSVTIAIAYSQLM